MSWWILPTTADIGVRAFSSSPEGTIVECVLGLQSIQISDKSPDALNHLTRSTGVWTIPFTNNALERGHVKFLDEELYLGTVENQWLVEHYNNYPKDPSGFDQWNKALHQRLDESFAKIEAFGK